MKTRSLPFGKIILLAIIAKLFVFQASAQINLFNPLPLGSTTRNQSIANKGLQVKDTAIFDTKVIFNGLTGVGTRMAVIGSNGVLSVQAIPSGGTPGGVNTNVQYNDFGAFGGDTNFTWDKSTFKFRVGRIGTHNTSLVLTPATKKLDIDADNGSTFTGYVHSKVFVQAGSAGTTGAFTLLSGSTTKAFHQEVRSNMATDWTLIWPDSAGQSGQFLRTDGIDQASWAFPPGGSGSPAGTNGQFQFNNASSFGGAQFTYMSSTGDVALYDHRILLRDTSDTTVNYISYDPNTDFITVQSSTGINFNDAIGTTASINFGTFYINALAGQPTSTYIGVNTDGSVTTLPTPTGTVSRISQGFGILSSESPLVDTGTISVDSTKFSTLNYVNENLWKINGNSNTSFSTNFIGTTNFESLKFKINNVQSGAIDFDNTSFGYRSLFNSSSGAHNTAIGYSSSDSCNVGTENTSIGYVSLVNNKIGDGNVSIGSRSLFNNLVSFNTAIGSSSLSFNTTGVFNTASGQASLVQNTIGSYNTAVGASSLGNDSIGSYNTAIGYNSNVSNRDTRSAISIGINSSALSNQCAISDSIHNIKVAGMANGAGSVLTDVAGNGVLTLQPVSASSQWVTTGSDIYYPTGFVGIGFPPANDFDIINSSNDTSLFHYNRSTESFYSKGNNTEILQDSGSVALKTDTGRFYIDRDGLVTGRPNSASFIDFHQGVWQNELRTDKQEIVKTSINITGDQDSIINDHYLITNWRLGNSMPTVDVILFLFSEPVDGQIIKISIQGFDIANLSIACNNGGISIDQPGGGYPIALSAPTTNKSTFSSISFQYDESSFRWTYIGN